MEDSQRQTASLLHWGLVSQYRSQLFGFAILWIMCMHSREFTPIPDNPLLSQSLLYDGIILVGGVGVEIKRGKPGIARLLPQLARYCACEEVAGLILVSGGSVRLPPTLAGKPLRNLCLNQLWGIAL